MQQLSSYLLPLNTLQYTLKFGHFFPKFAIKLSSVFLLQIQSIFMYNMGYHYAPRLECFVIFLFSNIPWLSKANLSYSYWNYWYNDKAISFFTYSIDNDNISSISVGLVLSHWVSAHCIDIKLTVFTIMSIPVSHLL